MGKADDKGEPVKTVTIGGKKVEVPIIFILPEESGEKEIERYEHPKVHIKKDDKAAESKEEPLEELTDGKLEEIEKPKFVAPKIAGGYGKAQALRRSVEEQKKRGAKTDDELAAEKEKKVPLGRWAKPEEISYTVAFLASPESDFITGQVISPNGGETIVGY